MDERTTTRRGYAGAFLVGVALMAAVDEIVFHQLLGWHHFYDGASARIGIVSDGVLHAGELVGLVGGAYLLADARRRDALSRLSVAAGLLVGLGAFQLWDGVIDHKLLRLHQVRYDVDLLPYDLVWNGSAIVLLAIGIALTVRARRREPRAGRGAGGRAR